MHTTNNSTPITTSTNTDKNPNVSSANINIIKSPSYPMQTEQIHHHQHQPPLHHINHPPSIPPNLQLRHPSSTSSPSPLSLPPSLPTPQPTQNNYNFYSHQLNKPYPPPLYTPMNQQPMNTSNNTSPSTAPLNSNYDYLQQTKYPTKPPPPLHTTYYNYSYQPTPSSLASQYPLSNESCHAVDVTKKLPDADNPQFPLNMHTNQSKPVYPDYSQPTPSSAQQQQLPQQSRAAPPHSSCYHHPPLIPQVRQPHSVQYYDYHPQLHEQRVLPTYTPNYGYQNPTNKSYLPPPPSPPHPHPHPHPPQSSYVPSNSYSYFYAQVIPQPQPQPSIDNLTTGSKRTYGNSFDEFNRKTTKKSLIAGVIYNSGAVFKRLKPTLNEEKSEVIYKQGLIRSQGRPFSSNLTGRFIYHEDLKSLLNHVDRRNNNKFVVYDMKNQIKSNNNNNNAATTTNSNISKGNDNNSDTSSSVTNNYNNISIHYENNLKNNEDTTITQILYSKLGDYNDPSSKGSASREILVEALDNLLNCKHNDILTIDGYKEHFNPIQKMISYNPTKHTSKEKRKEEKKEEKKENEENSSDNVLSYSTSSSSTTATTDTTSTANEYKTPERFNFHSLIKENFGLDEYLLVKTIRDNNGHILKLETIKPPVDKSGKFNYTSEWLKRKICYPRYKGGMNLHILPSKFTFLLYNDIKMLLWDIKEEILSKDETKIRDILNGAAQLVDDDLKLKLFGNKILYTQTLNR